MASSIKNLSQHKISRIHAAEKIRVGIIVSEWHSEITEALYDGAFKALIKNGVKEKNIIKKYVPGSFELTLGAQLLADSKKTDAVICLGCVIQGETKHFDFICDAVANGISHLNMKYNKPIVFGILTTDNLRQAQERSGGKHGNKGIEAGITALKMVQLKNELKKNYTLNG